MQELAQRLTAAYGCSSQEEMLSKHGEAARQRRESADASATPEERVAMYAAKQQRAKLLRKEEVTPDIFTLAGMRSKTDVHAAPHGHVVFESKLVWVLQCKSQGRTSLENEPQVLGNTDSCAMCNSSSCHRHLAAWAIHRI